MKINHQPLKLEFLAHLTIIIHTSQQTSEGNNIIDRKLLEIGLPWPALEEHLFLRRCCVYAFRYFINKKPQDILEHLISNCLRFNPDGGLSLLKLLSPYISQIDTAITNVQNIMELNEKLLIVIIRKTKNIIILNNLLILSAMYERENIMRACLAQGAFDFVTAQKAAAIHQNNDLTVILLNTTISPNFHNYKRTRADRHLIARYVRKFNNARRRDPFKKYLVEFMITENMLTFGGYEREELEDCVENLNIPMMDWSFENIFRLICYTDYETIAQLAAAYNA